MNYSFGAGPIGGFVGFVYYGTKYAQNTVEVFAGATVNILGKAHIDRIPRHEAYPGTYLNLA